jgi:hypothetical protein
MGCSSTVIVPEQGVEHERTKTPVLKPLSNAPAEFAQSLFVTGEMHGMTIGERLLILLVMIAVPLTLIGVLIFVYGLEAKRSWPLHHRLSVHVRLVQTAVSG